MKAVNNKKLYNAILAGASEVMNNKVQLNKINVFPVADGDTGSNLFSTMNTIIRDSRYNRSFKESMDSVADAALVGARGNSGIIFAQYFNGLSKGLSNSNNITVDDFIRCNSVGYTYAYNSISDPVEGTIISVMEVYVKALSSFSKKTTDFIKIIEYGYSEVEGAVKETTNQLKVLKKKSVVDSGAKGFMFFLKGFLSFIKSDKEEFVRDDLLDVDVSFDSSNHDVEDIKFRYCTEAMFVGAKLNTNEIRSSLNEYGDSLIVAANDRKGRIHIHTDRPDLVFDKISNFGDIIYQKADDMVRQNEIVSNRLSNIALVTDSVADIPKDIVDKYQIHVVNLNILIDQANYFDKLTINNDMVEKLMSNSNSHPSTSQPDTKTIENLYNYLLTYYDSIIVMTLSKELSGTFNVFEKVKLNLELDDKVSIINTKQNSGAEGLLVEKCAKAIESGKNHLEVVKEIESLVDRSKIIVKIKTLKNMISSGRLSTSAGKIAKFVKLRPLITLDEEGKGAIEKVAFSDNGASNQLINQLIKIDKTSNIVEYNIAHVNNENEALELSSTLEGVLGISPNYVTETSSIIAIGAGNGAIAVSFITEK